MIRAFNGSAVVVRLEAEGDGTEIEQKSGVVMAGETWSQRPVAGIRTMHKAEDIYTLSIRLTRRKQ